MGNSNQLDRIREKLLDLITTSLSMRDLNQALKCAQIYGALSSREKLVTGIPSSAIPVICQAIRYLEQNEGEGTGAILLGLKSLVGLD